MKSIIDLPFPIRKFIAVKYELEDELVLEQWVIPKGTIITMMTSSNHGIVSIPKNSKDVRGFEIPRQLFRY